MKEEIVGIATAWKGNRQHSTLVVMPQTLRIKPGQRFLVMQSGRDIIYRPLAEKPIEKLHDLEAASK